MCVCVRRPRSPTTWTRPPVWRDCIGVAADATRVRDTDRAMRTKRKRPPQPLTAGLSENSRQSTYVHTYVRYANDQCFFDGLYFTLWRIKTAAACVLQIRSPLPQSGERSCRFVPPSSRRGRLSLVVTAFAKDYSAMGRTSNISVCV